MKCPPKKKVKRNTDIMGIPCLVKVKSNNLPNLQERFTIN